MARPTDGPMRQRPQKHIKVCSYAGRFGQVAHGPFRIVDIAEQAGVSAATVDRVLHQRTTVSGRAVRQVEQALLDLERQHTQLRLGAKTLVLDVVIHAPGRFTENARTALEHELPGLRPATVRARFHARETYAVTDLVATLDGIGRRGRASDGVLLKAPDEPEVADAVDRLAARDIPVVTLVTDVRDCGRIAYVGLDNRSAGATAAYLMNGWLGRARGCVIATVSRSSMFGERERLAAFETAMAGLDPRREIVVLSDSDGLDEGVRGLVRSLLGSRRDVAGVYSIGGGNRGLFAELDAAGLTPRAYIGHDLYSDNVPLLLAGRFTAILNHDFRVDMRAACEQILRHHRLLPGAPTSQPAPVQVVTAHNLPPRLR
jgi:LacI family transcriptional regulator